MRRLVTTVGLVTLATGLAGCGGGDESGEQAVTPSVTVDVAATAGASTPAADRAVVPAALDFSAPLVDGTEFDARGLAGGTVVFWFWSPF